MSRTATAWCVCGRRGTKIERRSLDNLPRQTQRARPRYRSGGYFASSFLSFANMASERSISIALARLSPSMTTSASSSPMAEQSFEHSSPQGPAVAVLQADANRLQSRTEQLETLSVARRQLLLAVNEAQSLELLDPAVAGGDRNPEPAAEFQRGHGPFEGAHEDPCGVLVHH